MKAERRTVRRSAFASGRDDGMPVSWPALPSWGMQDYTRLLVWQRSRALTLGVHEATRALHPRTLHGLRTQLLRASMSIGANLAEGASRESRADFARFVSIALGSATEVEHHLITCSDLGVVDRSIMERLLAQVIEIRRMLFGLRRALVMPASSGGDERRGGSAPRASEPDLDPDDLYLVQ
jgi:four helix bundle protein